MTSAAYVGDVACVDVARDRVVAGIGSRVLVYVLDEKRRELRCVDARDALCGGARVHGIRAMPRGEAFAAYGARRTTVFAMEEVEGDARGGWRADGGTALPAHGAWVHDVRGVVEAESGFVMTIAIGLSDNSVERWSRGVDARTWTRTARVECASRCTLYTMALSASATWEGMRVAAGTIFNDIQIWGVVDGEVRARCVGHEGSLMRVRFGDDDDAVYSASDDRTARVWNVSNVMSSGYCEEVPPCAVLAGHVARVWDCVRIGGDRPVYATAGEDCTIRVWDVSNAHGTMTLADGVANQRDCEIATLRGHRGRGIWRLCVIESSNGDSFLASAGADGSVKIWNTNDWTKSSGANDGVVLRESETSYPESAMMVDEVEDQEDVAMESKEAAPKKRKTSKRRMSFFSADDEFIRVVRIARYGVLYVATNKGYLYRVVETSEGERWIWERLLENEYAIMSMSVERTDTLDIVSLADLEGIIHVVHVSQESGERKEMISWRASDPRVLLDVFSTQGRVYASIVGGVLKCWNRGRYSRCAFTLVNPYRHRILSIATSDALHLVLVGDQKGNLCVYDANTDDARELKLVAKKWSAHEKTSSINACEILPGPVFVTSGRDSNVCRWSLTTDGELLLDSKWTSPSKACVGFVSLNANGELARAAGFRETNFVVYSISDQRQMMKIRCQAQSTPHDVLMEDGDRVIFVHRQKTSLHIITRWNEHVNTAENESTSLWSHGREIHTVRIVPPPVDAVGAPLGIITGSEDGTVMRLLYDASRRDGTRVHSPGDICKHPGGRTVKAVSIFKEDEYSYILCAGGAKEVLLAFRLSWASDDLGSWDFKSVALIIPKPVDKAGTRAWTKGCGYVEPRAESDQRIMDVATYSRRGQLRVLYSTSLGAVSVVTMDERARVWRDISSLRHHACPALSVDVLEGESTWACSGGTDGTIALWRLDDSDIIDPAYVLEHAHQSGVNALCITRTADENAFIVVSGGDDQMLRVQEMRRDGDGVSPGRVGEYKFSHSSAMRSVWSDGERIISTSVDQRVKMWSISLTKDDICVAPTGGVMTQAPEPEDIDVLAAPDGVLTLVVAGRGFELFHIQ